MSSHFPVVLCMTLFMKQKMDSDEFFTWMTSRWITLRLHIDPHNSGIKFISRSNESFFKQNILVCIKSAKYRKYAFANILNQSWNRQCFIARKIDHLFYNFYRMKPKISERQGLWFNSHHKNTSFEFSLYWQSDKWIQYSFIFFTGRMKNRKLRHDAS